MEEGSAEALYGNNWEGEFKNMYQPQVSFPILSLH